MSLAGQERNCLRWQWGDVCFAGRVMPKNRPSGPLIGIERPASPQITRRIEQSGLDLPGSSRRYPGILADRHTEQHGEQPVPSGTAITAAASGWVQIGCLPELHLPKKQMNHVLAGWCGGGRLLAVGRTGRALGTFWPRLAKRHSHGRSGACLPESSEASVKGKRCGVSPPRREHRSANPHTWAARSADISCDP